MLTILYKQHNVIMHWFIYNLGIYIIILIVNIPLFLHLPQAKSPKNLCVCILCLAILCRWFKQLCGHHGVSGQAYYFYKPVGKGRTFGVRPERALESLKEGLRDPAMAFIYHCYNHYFCPIGYEEVPKNAIDAYK